jgi:Fe2+ transport system protein FeoA
LKATELNIGQSAKIIKISESDLSNHLLEMGCVPGTQIKMEFKAPAGDPIAFDIDGYILGLRFSEATLIEVETK